MRRRMAGYDPATPAASCCGARLRAALTGDIKGLAWGCCADSSWTAPRGVRAAVEAAAARGRGRGGGGRGEPGADEGRAAASTAIVGSEARAYHAERLRRRAASTIRTSPAAYG